MNSYLNAQRLAVNNHYHRRLRHCGDYPETLLDDLEATSGTSMITCMDCGRDVGWLDNGDDTADDERAVAHSREKGWICVPGVEILCPRCKRRRERKTRQDHRGGEWAEAQDGLWWRGRLV